MSKISKQPLTENELVIFEQLFRLNQIVLEREKEREVDCLLEDIGRADQAVLRDKFDFLKMNAKRIFQDNPPENSLDLLLAHFQAAFVKRIEELTNAGPLTREHEALRSFGDELGRWFQLQTDNDLGWGHYDQQMDSETEGPFGKISPKSRAKSASEILALHERDPKRWSINNLTVFYTGTGTTKSAARSWVTDQLREARGLPPRWKK